MFFIAQEAGSDTAATAGLLAAVFFAILIAMIVSIAINVIICLLIYLPFSAVPIEHRKMQPGLVFLLLIPLFNVFWNFIVFLRIPESFESYFATQGRADLGDCGKKIGLWIAICGVFCFVPCVNYVAGPAYLVLFIVFLVKIWGLKGQMALPGAGLGATPPPPPPARRRRHY